MLKKALLLVFLLAGSSFAWWDTSFPYRTMVNISNAGTTLTDYQVNLTLNTQALVSAGKMRPDCADLRAISSNDSSQLPFWIESGCNNITTKIWVKLPSIPNPGTISYLYYGNPSAANKSNSSEVFVSASGGNMTYSGNYAIHKFTGNGTFTPGPITSVDALVVAGGGAGAGVANGGGGGAGGLRYISGYAVSSSPINVVVGNGGAGVTNPANVNGANGNNSSFGAIIASGGGGGAYNDAYGSAGGSGGGGAGSGSGHNELGGAGNAGGYTPVEGYAGGNGKFSSPYCGGGGGGAGGIGGGTTNPCGAGGIGVDYSTIFGTSAGANGWFAGGGGAGYTPQGAGPGAGGNGGGGAGAPSSQGSSGAGLPGINGTGGGGGNGWLTGGSGGSGIVLVRYLNRLAASPEPTASTLPDEEALQFTNRQALSISNTGPALTDYQVNLTINTTALIAAGKMKSDCSDIRFTNSTDHNTQNWPASYRFWIESGCNTTATKVWVKVPSIPMGTSTIYLYHGNSSAVSASSASATFLFFDDFSDGALGAQWQAHQYAGSGGSYAEAGGGLKVQGGTAGSAQYHVEQASAMPTPDKFELIATVQSISGIVASGNILLVSVSGMPESMPTTRSGVGFSGADPPERAYAVNGAGGSSAPSVTHANQQAFKIMKNGAYWEYSRKEGGIWTSFYNGTFSGWNYATMRIMFEQANHVTPVGNPYVIWDDIRARKYTYPEPTATEQPPDATAPLVQIQSPAAMTYTTGTVPVNFIASDDAGISSCTARLNGTVNSSDCSNYTLTLGNGNYTLNVSANDTAGNMNSTQVSFTVAIPAGLKSNSTQATTDNNGIAAANLSFSFTAGTLKLSAGAQETTKALRASAGVNNIEIKAKVTLSGQTVTGKQVTYTISE